MPELELNIGIYYWAFSIGILPRTIKANPSTSSSIFPVQSLNVFILYPPEITSVCNRGPFWEVFRGSPRGRPKLSNHFFGLEVQGII